jgi:integrase
VSAQQTFDSEQEAQGWLRHARSQAGQPSAPRTARRPSRRRSFGSVRRLPSGRYQASYLGLDARRHVAPSTFPAKAEADLWLSAVRTDMARGRWISPARSGITLAQLVDLYRMSQVDVRRSTRQTETFYLSRYVLPYLGSRAIGQIDLETVQSWVTTLAHSGGRGGRALAPSTVEKAGHLLSKFLQWAMDTRRIPHNPVRGAKWPAKTQISKWTLDPEGVRQLADVIDQRFAALVIFLAFTGLRIGEALAVRVADVDLAKREVTVSRRLYDLGGHHDFDGPKTTAGTRIVPMPRLVVEAVADHIVARGLRFEQPLFPAPRGGYIRYGDFRRTYWNPAIEALGLVERTLEGRPRRFTVHQLRKTAITVWVDAGVPPETAAAWAGHTDVRILYTFYKDRKAEVERAAVANVDRVLST